MKALFLVGLAGACVACTDSSQGVRDAGRPPAASDVGRSDTGGIVDALLDVGADAGRHTDSGALHDTGELADSGGSLDTGGPSDSGGPFDSGDLADSGGSHDTGRPSDSGDLSDTGAGSDTGDLADAAAPDAAAPDAATPDAGDDPCADLAGAYVSNTAAPMNPPFRGTIFIAPNTITAADPTSYISKTYRGTGVRTMFDRRTGRFDTQTAHLFDVVFATRMVEAQVNLEMSEAEANQELDVYLPAIGRVPDFLLTMVDSIWLHRGVHGFGGGNRNLLIHTGRGDEYIRDGILEETFVHEATHTSIDPVHRAAPLWTLAQMMDQSFISTYARDNPGREDLAELMPLWLGLRTRPAALSQQQRDAIEASSPNRLLYLDCQGWL